MSKSQRTKGASGEREACALLSEEFGRKTSRNLGQARDSGFDIELPPFNIEVKRRARIAGLYEWLEQANNGAGLPTLMLRADGKPWLVVMPFGVWARLARGEMI